jgi:hypothetical protein
MGGRGARGKKAERGRQRRKGATELGSREAEGTKPYKDEGRGAEGLGETENARLLLILPCSPDPLHLCSPALLLALAKVTGWLSCSQALSECCSKSDQLPTGIDVQILAFKGKNKPGLCLGRLGFCIAQEWGTAMNLCDSLSWEANLHSSTAMRGGRGAPRSA